VRLFESAVWDKSDRSSGPRRDALAALYVIISSEALLAQESFTTREPEIISSVGRPVPRDHETLPAASLALQRQATMAITLGAFCLAILTVSILGGLLPLATVLNHTRLQVYLSFSAGTMLGAAFFHMMPEAIRLGSVATIHWTAFGLLGLFFLERFFSFHHHETPAHPAESHGRNEHAGHVHKEHAGHVHNEPHADGAAVGPAAAASPAPARAMRALPWGSAAFGLVIHSLIGGVALASAVAADYKTSARLGGAGLGVFVATLVHKPADALTITSLMLRGGSSRWSALVVNLGFGLMIPVGVAFFAVGMFGLGSSSASSWTAGALAFSAGTFLCIALSDLLPELQFHSHDRLKLSIALLAGFALMAGTAAIEPAEEPANPPVHNPQAVRAK
jgi:zinc and cadmium transporter